MKGGFNNPPNQIASGNIGSGAVPSMKGGFNNPPNLHPFGRGGRFGVPSMKGGFNNPPNSTIPFCGALRRSTFNEGGVQ